MKTHEKRPDQPGLDERTAAFTAAALSVVAAIERGELKNRDMVLLSASSVIRSFLQIGQYLSGQEIKGLAKLNRQLTEFLDNIVLNAEPDDRRLQALRELAENERTWPTLVRPGDEKFTAVKLEKLNVGSKALVGSLAPNTKRLASLATPRNRLTLRLVRRIENRARAVLHVQRNGVECNDEEAREHLRIIEPDVPEKEHTRFLQLLRRARDNPVSAKNRSTWNRLLTEFVLILDPKLEKFPDLKKVKSAKSLKYVKTEQARFRSQLQKFFFPAVKALSEQTASELSAQLPSQDEFTR